MAEFDFKELVAKAHFDYVGPAFPEWWANNKKLFVFPSLKNLLGKQGLNRQYFLTITLGYEGDEFTLPNEPLVSLSLVKTIVETPTVGKYRRGTVKEYINTEDYHITLRGVCISEDLESYPYEQVSELNRLFNINAALDVVNNPFFALYGIEKIVLKEIHFDEMVGQPNMQKYVITAVSDSPFFADLKERDAIVRNLF